MIHLYRQIESSWFKLPRQLRFILLGGFNTLLSYLIFVFLIEIIHLSYPISLLSQYLITVNLSIFSMRYYVFRSQSPVMKEYFKAWTVYLGMLGFNYLFLYLAIDCLHYHILLSQAMYTLLSTIITYLLHRFYSFHQ